MSEVTVLQSLLIYCVNYLLVLIRFIRFFLFFSFKDHKKIVQATLCTMKVNKTGARQPMSHGPKLACGGIITGTGQ